MEAAESLANTVATGKKAVTGAYNVLGKVTSSVAGVVGAKTVVGEGFNSVKKAVGKSGLMGGILSPFGEIDMLDELRDQWTHESKVSSSGQCSSTSFRANTDRRISSAHTSLGPYKA
jgi:hypothetical protein